MIKFSKEIIELAFNKMPISSIVILCSMGVDSVAATHFLNKTLKKNPRLLGFPDEFDNIRTWHFNHNLRPQNDLMQESYLKFNEKLEKIKYSFVYKLKCASDTEDDFRKERLKIIKDNNNSNTMFITAHHLDDATESYMLNVLRGKEGFLPIPFITNVGNSLIVHPFIFSKKSDFIQYAERNDILKFVVEDETNLITKGSRRNFIRNDILPLIKEQNMGLDTIVKKKMNQRLFLEMIKND